METIVQGLTAYNLGAADEQLHIDELHVRLAIHAIAASAFLGSGPITGI